MSSGSIPEMGQQHDSPAWPWCSCPWGSEKWHSWRSRDAPTGTQWAQSKLFQDKPALPSLGFLSSSTGVLTLPSSSLPFTFPFMNEVCRRRWRPRFNSWLGKISRRRKWQPTPAFLPGKSHGQRSLAGYSPWGLKESDMTERLSTHTHIHTISK